ncbi:SRPBCC family protein [Aeromicrobium sp.]|uniref:SRPBCC family protein n=1 Tax=Aeromicrobium sp. TaxID=1871063 RepID=UPI003D6AB519
MKITGSHTIPFPIGQVWDALLDPAVLVRTIPGCERLAEAPGEHTYDMTVTAGVAAIRGTYAGTCALSDLAPNESLVMRLQGAGAPGTVGATVQVRFSEPQPDVTEIAYDADAVVGGMVGGVGQRMLTSVSKRMAGEFFDNVRDALGAPAVSADDAGRQPGRHAGEPAASGVYVAPPHASRSRDDFLTGVVVGAGLVLLGVVAGAVFSRRR